MIWEFFLNAFSFKHSSKKLLKIKHIFSKAFLGNSLFHLSYILKMFSLVLNTIKRNVREGDGLSWSTVIRDNGQRWPMADNRKWLLDAGNRWSHEIVTRNSGRRWSVAIARKWWPRLADINYWKLTISDRQRQWLEMTCNDHQKMVKESWLMIVTKKLLRRLAEDNHHNTVTKSWLKTTTRKQSSN